MKDKFEIIKFQPQPDFPSEDISENNASMASWYLETSAEHEAYLDNYHENMQPLHDIGNAALAYMDAAPGNNRKEYTAFCKGFATIDYLSVLLNSRPFEQISNGKGMGDFILDHESFADVELAKRVGSWRSSHENTLLLLLEASDRYSESQKQFAARLIGAQVASELLSVER